VEREAVVTVEVDGGAAVTLVSPPWRFSGALDHAPRHLGAFGADNEAVLIELLGLDAGALADLSRRGVLRHDEPAPAGAPPDPPS
jgi:crotonobetainyl-CoA:carnitine CoA-transferase CaiB-like acyl-CoA transferase